MTNRSTDDHLPHVAVAIPAYNLERYVADGVRSVLQQTYRGPLSIVALDDGSTDGTLEALRELARDDDRIRVATQSNAGRAQARNRLIELADAELLAWLDGDDLAAPTWIAEQVEYLQRHDDCVAVSAQGYAMTADARAIGPIPFHPLDGEAIDGRHIAGEANAFFQSGVLVRKSAVLRAGGYDPTYPHGEDFALWLRLAEIGKLANLSAVHLYYRVHATSANWTANVEQRTQGHAIVNAARVRRGLPPLERPPHEIPPAKKDDWNRRVYWIDLALRSGNPATALAMLPAAIRRHPSSLVLWVQAAIAALDSVWLCGNRTHRFEPGKAASIAEPPAKSFYRLERRLNELRRRVLGRNAVPDDSK